MGLGVGCFLAPQLLLMPTRILFIVTRSLDCFPLGTYRVQDILTAMSRVWQGSVGVSSWLLAKMGGQGHRSSWVQSLCTSVEVGGSLPSGEWPKDHGALCLQDTSAQGVGRGEVRLHLGLSAARGRTCIPSRLEHGRKLIVHRS